MINTLYSLIPNLRIVAVIFAVIVTLVLYGSLPLIGWIINKLETLELTGLTRAFGAKLASFICNRLTIIGVIVHEFAHAFFATITGAKVTKISVLDIFKGDQLGHVEFVMQGNKFQQAFQAVFASCAPVIVGLICSHLLISNLVSGTLGWQGYLIDGFLLISILNHTSMSDADIDIYKTGLKIVVPVTFFILYFFVVLTTQVNPT